jgi:hypothetical protein
MRVSPSSSARATFSNILQFRFNANFIVHSAPPYTCNMSTSEHGSNMNTFLSKYFSVSENRERI